MRGKVKLNITSSKKIFHNREKLPMGWQKKIRHTLVLWKKFFLFIAAIDCSLLEFMPSLQYLIPWAYKAGIKFKRGTNKGSKGAPSKKLLRGMTFHLIFIKTIELTQLWMLWVRIFLQFLALLVQPFPFPEWTLCKSNRIISSFYLIVHFKKTILQVALQVQPDIEWPVNPPPLPVKLLAINFCC